MKIFYYTLILFVICVGCKSTVSYKGNKDLMGNWEGKTIDIISPSNERVSFPMSRYGFSTMRFDNDSTYYFLMEIMHDVILEKEVFGNPYTKTVLKSGYKKYKTGYFLASNSEIILYDYNRILSNKLSYYFNEQILYTKFKDKENKQWIISWEK